MRPHKHLPWQATRWGRQWRAAQAAGTPTLASLTQGSDPQASRQEGPLHSQASCSWRPHQPRSPLASKPQDTGKLCLPKPSDTI